MKSKGNLASVMPSNQRFILPIIAVSGLFLATGGVGMFFVRLKPVHFYTPLPVASVANTQNESTDKHEPPESSGAKIAALFETPALRHIPIVPAPSVAAVSKIVGAGSLSFVGYVTDSKGEKSYYFKDSQKNLILKAAKEETAEGLALVSDNGRVFTIKYGGVLYEVPQR
jgi:hypothetical protein